MPRSSPKSSAHTRTGRSDRDGDGATTAWQEFSRNAAWGGPTGTPQKPSASILPVKQDTPGKSQQSVIKETFKEASVSNMSGRRENTARINKVMHVMDQAGGAVGSTWLDGAVSDQDALNSGPPNKTARLGSSSGLKDHISAAGYTQASTLTWISTGVSGTPGNTVNYATAGFGFEAEVLGIEQEVHISNQATNDVEQVTKSKEDEDDLLIHF